MPDWMSTLLTKFSPDFYPSPFGFLATTHPISVELPFENAYRIMDPLRTIKGSFKVNFFKFRQAVST